MSPSITFVCCVESGPLEVQTVRMVESLRRWGGSFAEVPVIAVTPRAGPGLAASTMETFRKHRIRYVREESTSPWRWFKFYNKPLALASAEKLADTDAVGWLDSDMVVAGEPSLLELAPGEDFLGCASDKEMGTSGPDDPFHPLWQANCRALGIDLDALPWVSTEREGQKIRVYWNGGIFIYRRTTEFGRHYLETCTRLLDARNRTTVSGFSIGINEMSAIGLAMHLRKMAFRALPFSHDFIMSSLTHAKWYREEQLRTAKMIHYHDAMWPWFFETFVQCLKATHPPIAEWLSALGPMRNEASFPRRIWAKLLKRSRERQERAYVDSCRPV
jgi:hypothetical protein